LTPNTGGTDKFGQYAIGTFTANDTTQPIAFTAPSDGIVNAIQVRDVTPSPAADAANSTVAASPTSVASDGVVPSTITVTLKDASNNPVGGKTVTLASSRSSSDTISVASGPSSASGVVTFTVTSSTPGLSVYTATDVTDANLVIAPSTATVTFLSNAVSAATSTVTAAPASVVADGLSASTITVILRDASNNVLDGKGVTLAKISGPGSPVIDPVSATTNASGVATFTVTSTIAGTNVFEATGDNITLSEKATVTFTAGAVSSTLSTVTASPSSVMANGVSTSTITVTLKDANGNLVAGKTVTLASSRSSSDTISAASGPSSDSGVVTFTVASSTPGLSVYTATDVTDANLVIDPSTANVTFTMPPATITWGAATTIAGDSDVTTDGVLMYAVHWSGTDDTVNGVAFTAPSGTTVALAGGTALGSAPTVLSPAYQNILKGENYQAQNKAATLYNLTVGKQYKVQIWCQDTRYETLKTTTITGGPTLTPNTGGTDKFGQYAIGTFTANDTTQPIAFTAVNDGIVNAIQVRDVTGGTTSDFASWALDNDVIGGPAGDSDNDGIPNLVEYALIDGGERGSFDSATRTVSFTKRASPYGTDVTTTIEESDDLGITDRWETVTATVVGDTMSYTLPAPSPSQPRVFARLKVSQN